MVVLLVDPVTPPVEPELVSLELGVPLLPMELVLPVDGVVVLELVEPVPVVPVEPVVSFLLQAPSERAATTARVAVAH